jgi:hypothetical protein
MVEFSQSGRRGEALMWAQSRRLVLVKYVQTYLPQSIRLAACFNLRGQHVHVYVEAGRSSEEHVHVYVEAGRSISGASARPAGPDPLLRRSAAVNSKHGSCGPVTTSSSRYCRPYSRSLPPAWLRQPLGFSGSNSAIGESRRHQHRPRIRIRRCVVERRIMGGGGRITLCLIYC